MFVKMNVVALNIVDVGVNNMIRDVESIYESESE